MKDTFEEIKTSLSSPARDAIIITPDDANDLPAPTRAIYVGTGESLSVQMVSGQIVRFDNVVAGIVYPFRIARVLATETTATELIGLR